MIEIVLSLLFGTFVSWLAPFAIIPVMKRVGCVDTHGFLLRKIHKKDIPLGGGVALFLGVVATVCSALFLQVFSWQDLGNFNVGFIFLAAAVLLVGGFFDDKYRLSAGWQIIAPLLAVFITVSSGIVPHGITNVFTGGTVGLSSTFDFLPFVLAFCWLITTTFATKLVDGVDGLVASIFVVGSILLGISAIVQDKHILLIVLAFAMAASGVGFLRWNWHPAVLFLGEGGSTVAGFLLGTLAILTESKFSVAFFMLALPMLDMVRVVYVRLARGKSVFYGDKEHLHHHLLESGFSQTRIVYFFCGLSLLFGLLALFIQRTDWVYVFAILLVCLFFVSFWISDKRKT